VGCFTYPGPDGGQTFPVQATHVPVGDDQKTAPRLARDIAKRFNRDYDGPDFFPVPEPLIQGPGARIMSLKAARKRCRNPDPSELSRINLRGFRRRHFQEHQKRGKAKTDLLGDMPSDAEGLKGRPEVANLVGIYKRLSGEDVDSVLSQFGGQGFWRVQARTDRCHRGPTCRRSQAPIAHPGRPGRN